MSPAANAAPTGQIDAGLDRDDHARLQDGIRARLEQWRFVHLHAQAVTGAVREELAVARIERAARWSLADYRSALEVAAAQRVALQSRE